MNTDLIHDWNIFTGAEIAAHRRVALNDETLRDGLQNPSVHDPTIAEKIEILHLMESLGIDTVNIGLPGAGPRAYADTEARAHAQKRHQAHHRNFRARRHAHRSRYLHWLQPHPPLGGRLDRRSSSAHN